MKKQIFRISICTFVFILIITQSINPVNGKNRNHSTSITNNLTYETHSYERIQHIGEIMELLQEKVGKEIKSPKNQLISEKVPKNISLILNNKSLQEKKWAMLKQDFFQASVYKIIFENRPINFSLNKYNAEILKRGINLLKKDKTLTKGEKKLVNRLLEEVMHHEYNIVFTAMLDSKNLIKYKPHKKTSSLLKQANVHLDKAIKLYNKKNYLSAFIQFQHANYKAHDILSFYGLKYSFKAGKIDSDRDEIADLIENYFGTNPYSNDTDGDGLPDLYELENYLEPVKTNDANDDNDEDGLNNIDEYRLETDLNDPDMDSDGLNDGIEVNETNTDPTLYDTDGDTIGDGRELELNLNPLSKDSNGDGVEDQDENFIQEIRAENIDESLLSQIAIPIVTINGSAFENETRIWDATERKGIFDDVAGIIGHAIEIRHDKPFKEATISFKYDSKLLGKTNPDDLKILWFDEENFEFVLMPGVEVNKKESTVSIKTNQLSIFMLVDWKKWREALSFLYKPGKPTVLRGEIKNLTIGTTFEYSDHGILNFGNTTMKSLNSVIQNESIPDNFINNQDFILKDKNTLIADSVEHLAKTKNKWKSLIVPVNKNTILTNTDVNVIAKKAMDNQIKIFTINTDHNPNTHLLRQLAEKSGGQYYEMTFDSEKDALKILNDIRNNVLDEEDKDGDGIPDVIELNGIRLFDGSIIKTSISIEDKNNDGVPDGRDDDQDGLTDGYELGYTDEEGNAFSEAMIGVYSETLIENDSLSVTQVSAVTYAKAY